MDILTLALIHRIVVTVFFLFFLFKTILLISKKTDLLDKIRSKTKIIDIVLGVLIVVTGVYMMMLTKNHSMWINIKATLVLVAIPLGIIAMKKSNVLMAIIVNVILIAAYGIGESRPWNKNAQDAAVSDSTATDSVIDISNLPPIDTSTSNIILQNKLTIKANAKEIYTKLCATCHGDDGAKGMFGATNLAYSMMNSQQKIAIISNGKGVMRAYKNELSEDEIEALAIYLTTLLR